MHVKYKHILNTHYLNARQSTIKSMSSFISRLPSDPDNLTEEWILDFLSKFSNPNTKYVNFSRLRIILNNLDKSHLLSGIHMKPPKSPLSRSDFLSPDDIAAMLRAAFNITQRALIEFLLESGARIGEALNISKTDVQIQKDFVLVTLNGKTGIRQVPLLKDNLTSFLFISLQYNSDNLQFH